MLSVFHISAPKRSGCISTAWFYSFSVCPCSRRKMAFAESSSTSHSKEVANMSIRDLKRAKRRRTEQASRSSSSQKATKSLVDGLGWRPVNTSSFAGMDDGGGMMMFEELDGVDVAWDEDQSGRKVARFVVSGLHKRSPLIDLGRSSPQSTRTGRGSRERAHYVQSKSLK